MKFAHMADCHLGGWRHPKMRELSFKYFEEAISRSIKKNVDFILISGDLFNTSLPGVDILKATVKKLKELRNNGIPVYIIAGSHDYSVSGKTFLEVLEKAGFCELAKFCELEDSGEIILKPLKHETFHIYGYPGKKSGLEIEDLRRVKIKEP